LAVIIGIVLEIAIRVFRRMPTAMRSARRGLGLVLLTTSAAVLWAPVPTPATAMPPQAHPLMFALVTEVLPRLAYGSAWLCVAQLVVMLRYLVPLDPLHRAVLFGFGPYLVLYAAALGSARSPEPSWLVYELTPLVYLGVLVMWTHAAWRREPDAPAPRDVVAWLQPWR
jgi:hypothetical protein